MLNQLLEAEITGVSGGTEGAMNRTRNHASGDARRVRRGACAKSLRAAAVVPLLAACGGPAGPLEPAGAGPDVERFLAGPGPLVASPELGPGEIDGERAEALARFRLDHIGPAHRAFHEETRGAPIAWASLSACGRAFVGSPFRPLPASLPISVRRSAASWWVVTFCAGEPQMTIAVNTLSRDIRPDGSTFRLPERSGNHFLPRAVRVTPAASFMIPPERAVEAVATATGALVVPPLELVKADRVIPQFARWRVLLDRDVALRKAGSDETIRTDLVYYGHHSTSLDPVLLVPTAVQRPTPLHFRDASGDLIRVEPELKPDRAVEFDIATPASTSADRRGGSG